MQTSQVGVDLIKEFEGFESKAYPDPGTGGAPWTIGYGRAYGVKPGDIVTRAQAEEMLKEDLRHFEAAVSDLIKVQLNQNEFDALVSFTYNCGEGALGESTMRKRLNAGEAKCPVFQQELPKWVNGGNGPLPGLVRRREAEAKLACTPYTGDVGKPQGEESYLEQAAFYYEALPHQVTAWRALENVMTPEAIEVFKKAYRGEEKPVGPAPVEPKPTEPVKDEFPLDVPYFNQNDSATAHGHRMCFSSSMAMALDYIDPEAIKGDDDWYLGVVFKFGDTVSSEAQEAAARSLGFDAQFRMDGTPELLEEILDSGTPVPVGILHKGHVSKPTGGGHWICLIGYDETHFIVNDPAGDLDLVNGGYHNWNSGAGLRYSKKNLLKRWNIANPHDGWLMDLRQQ